MKTSRDPIAASVEPDTSHRAIRVSVRIGDVLHSELSVSRNEWFYIRDSYYIDSDMSRN